MANKTCPEICPVDGVYPKTHKPEYLEAGSARQVENRFAGPYVPGRVQPPEPRVYPPDAPPRYLPQPTDSTSGDFLTMGPVGPWAAGHVDWTPQAGMTGVRPVVDKYSMTRYSTGEWRKNNKYILTPRATDKAKALNNEIQQSVKNANDSLDQKMNESNNTLKERVKLLKKWKKIVMASVHGITDEIEALDANRAKLKAASRILMLPEAIAKECIELRTHRYEPDLVRDDAEQELVNEVAIVGEIRRVFQSQLMMVEEQMLNNRAAKVAIELDYSDKLLALKVDTDNLSLDLNSTLLTNHPGVARWPENGTTLEYWEHFCNESVRNCEEVRKKSEDLRKDVMTVIIKGAQDMKTQCDRTNAALAETVDVTAQMCNKLEETLKDNLKTIAENEKGIDYLLDQMRLLDARKKQCSTRLYGRNYDRPRVENCRDPAQYALMAEAKFVKETNESFTERLRQAEAVRADLMQYRGQLEKAIACKRKSMNIDGDRLLRVRAHMPTPEEFANA